MRACFAASSVFTKPKQNGVSVFALEPLALYDLFPFILGNAMLTFHVKAITDRCSHFLYAVFPFFFFFFTGLMLDVIDTMRNHASCNYLSNYSGFMWRRAQKSLSQFFPGRLIHPLFREIAN